jgi:NRPS condensation-like uncharacterized protein
MAGQDDGSASLNRLTIGRIRLSPAKQALLDERVRRALAGAAQPLRIPVIKRVARDVELPLTLDMECALERLRTISHVQQFHICKSFPLAGQLNEAALEQTIREVERRHEILRTRFPLMNGRRVQLIESPATIALPLIDLQHLPEDARFKEASRILTLDMQRDYDPERERLWRVVLLRLGEERCLFFLTINHLCCDAWALDLLVRDIWIIYRNYSRGLPSPLAEIPVQFADYAHWQRELLASEAAERLSSYWKHQLAGMGVRPALYLPREMEVGAEQNYRAEYQYLDIPASLTESLLDLSRRKGVTFFMLLFAALIVLLHRYTGKDDIGVRSAVSGRHLPETQEMIAALADLVVLRTNLSGVNTFSELLQRVRNVILEAYEYQALPSMKLYEYGLGPTGDVFHPTIAFNFLLVARDTSSGIQGRAGVADSFDLDFTSMPITHTDVREPKVPVPGMVWYTQLNGLTFDVQVSYQWERYERAVISELLHNYRIILEEIVARPEQRLADFPLQIEPA